MFGSDNNNPAGGHQQRFRTFNLLIPLAQVPESKLPYPSGGIGMKRAVFVAIVMMQTTLAMAEHNFVQQFLNRYRPPAADATLSANPSQLPEQALQQMIREGALPISVNDVVRLMIDSNLDLRVNRFSPLTQQFLLNTLFRPFEPTLRLSAFVNHNSQPTPTLLIAGKSLTHRYTAQFSQFFSTGLGVSVTASMNRNSDNNQFNTFNPSYSGTITYGFSQNFLQNFGRAINMHTIRVAQTTKAASDVQFELDLIDLVTNAVQMYWDLVGAREDIKVKQEALKLADKTLSDNRRQVAIGTLAPIDVVQSETNLASRQEQMVLSTFSADQLQDRIKRVITSADDPAMILAKLTPVEPVHRPAADDLMPIEDAIKYALENRPEMRQFGLTLQGNDVDLQFAKNQLLPSLVVSGGYTQSGVGGNLIDRVSGQIVSRGGLNDAFSQIFGYNYTGYSVGFSFLIPLSNKSAQAEYSRLMATRQTTEAKHTALAQAIALQVRNACSAVEMNRARITTAEKTRELEERQLDAEQKKFQLGSGQIRFVLQEQQNLTAAQTDEIQALVNYTKALVDFDKAIGRTLKKNNVEIDKELKVAVKSDRYARGN